MSLAFSSIVSSIDAHYGDASRGAFTQAKLLEYVNSETRLLRVFYDLPTSEYISQIPVWNGVFVYPIPTGYKGYISLMQNFYITDDTNFFFTNTEQFWADQTGRNIAADQRKGMSREFLIRLLNPYLANFALSTMDTFNGNGTWQAFGDASNVYTNNQYYYNGFGSVAFDLTYATGTGGIFVDNMLAVDLSGTPINHVGTLFEQSFFPSFTGWTSITFQWGSSVGNYYQQTATTQFSGTPFMTGWQQLGYAWSNATTVGVPDPSQITFMRYTLNFPNTMPPQFGISLDSIWMRQQLLMNLTFTSELLVTDTTGALKEEFANFNTSQDWTLNLDSEFKDWIVFRVLERAFVFVKPTVLSIQELKEQLTRIKMELETAYPSRRQLPMDNYYETIIENPVPDTSSVYQPGLSGTGFNPNNWGY